MKFGFMLICCERSTVAEVVVQNRANIEKATSILCSATIVILYVVFESSCSVYVRWTGRTREGYFVDSDPSLFMVHLSSHPI
jgi:hypothetical protein